MDKHNNPIKVVRIDGKDYKAINYSGFGEPQVFGDGATEELRTRLAAETHSVLEYFSQDFAKWPGVPAIAKVSLRPEALAKSHRPQNLFSSTSCPIVGTLDFGEILISVTEKGLSSLQKRLKNSFAVKVSANISAVEKIEAYKPKDRICGYHVADLSEAIANGDRLKLQLFDYNDSQKNIQSYEALKEFARENEISLEHLQYGSRHDLIAAESHDANAATKLTAFIGLRSVTPIPKFRPTDFNLQTTIVGKATEGVCPAPEPELDYPIVGLIDSGVCPSNTLLQPWIADRKSYVPPGGEDYSHGTMVAGLIVNPRRLNHQDPRFPDSQCKIVDINVFPNGGTVSEDELVMIIEEVITTYPHVKVWNLSLGGERPVGTTTFSDFAHFLDEMHDKHQCLFVVAAGNQNSQAHWPTTSTLAEDNRISSPADSIRSLTVGSLAHKHSPLALSKTDDVSPFSRIGPGPCFVPKPEVTHYGGNITSSGVYAQMGVLSLGPGNTLCESIGTSFACPIVSSIAGHLYHFLSNGGELYVPPERVKALIVHSALLSPSAVNRDNINYRGFGRPGDIIDHLYCDPNCMTFVFETDLKHGGFEFERFPFPIPDCLNTSEGKFRGEILMTLVYSPITNKSYSSEYCRTNVDVGMGSYVEVEEGKRSFKSRVPAAPKDMRKLYEASQVEHGFKWSPVKAYHSVNKQGIDVKEWRLKMDVMRRAEEALPHAPQRATLVLSLRGLDPTQPVYNETVQKLNQMGWVSEDIDHHIRIQL